MVYKSYRKVLIAFGSVLYGYQTHGKYLTTVGRYMQSAQGTKVGLSFQYTAAYKHQGQQGLRRQGIQEEARTAALKQAVDT